ncbi:5-bromo-4-chloroindolyl phosphate hydrolysis family protein [uncultured Gemmiger sp.]|uniref:5-bromo-4-chloroindolyl phosphate hydrolysis family protein n=1 Tax=uncultured Gemmiger sp. TaxID=1623490 RepID=UPI002600758C|nr:5-bromo-4-chloroindolyl phosphate hydrolysis family protein [uncultured Gemmiger sp.]
MSKIQEIRKKPVLPLWLAALGCLLGAAILPVYTLWGLVADAVLTAAIYLVAARLCPVRILKKELPYDTGEKAVDQMLSGISANLDALHALNDAIPDAQLSAEMDRMEKAGRGILQAVEANPEKADQISRFARYYLPEVVKIMAAYARMEQGGIRGDNAEQIQSEVRTNAATMATAFENQLDALYSAEAMDISTDIQVLDTILKSQNLAK